MSLNLIMNETMFPRIFFAFLIIIAFLIYPILNKRGENAHIIKLPIDDIIPLVPIFSIPYILYIPFLLITLIYFVAFTEFYRTISIAVIFCLVIASLVYLFYQTTVPRPEITNSDIFSKLVLYIYLKDHPYNCFPSLHTALSMLSFLYWFQVLPNLAWIIGIGIFVILVVLSTILIKQHYTPDIISGVVLAIISFYISRCI